MSYSLSDFKTRKNVSTQAKKELWKLIIERSFGGIECAKNAYETHYKKGTWQSYIISGMIAYLDELTGNDYGTDNKQLQIVAGTLACQFKKRFPEIMYLMSGTSCSSLNEAFFTSPLNQSKTNKVDVKPKQVFENVDHSKVFSVLAEIYSQKLNEAEKQFIAKNLINT